MSSCPSQKGQYSPPINVAGSSRKSLGRLRRSVEMITQRPVTGSFRSSDKLVGSRLCYVERVTVHLDRRLAAAKIDRHDVEAASTLGQAVARQIVQRHRGHPPPLQRR